MSVPAEVAYQAFVAARRMVVGCGLARPLRGMGGIWGQLVYRLSGPPGQPRTIGGHQMVLARRGYPPLDMLRGTWELDTVELIERLLRPGDCVLDVGAHVGYFTLLAARAVQPLGRVIAVEADPENAALLRDNVARNGYEQVQVVPKAVSNMPGEAWLYASAHDNGRHSLYPIPGTRRAGMRVEATTLDAILEAAGWPRVDLIKLDIEGSEAAALEGLQQFLARQRDVRMILEICPRTLGAAGWSPEALLERVRGAGFRLYLYRTTFVPLSAEQVAPLLGHLREHGAYKNVLCVRGDGRIEQ